MDCLLIALSRYKSAHAEQRSYIYLHCVAARGVDASYLGVTRGGGKKATCQLMTNIVHLQPICFLCALDEVSDASNLWSAPHTDNEQYVFGRERCTHKLGLPQCTLWWMRAIIVDACDFSSIWTTNIGLTPQIFLFFFQSLSLSLSLAIFLFLLLGYIHLKKKFQVARFQQRGKDLLCDNCSCLLATWVQVRVLRGWHMEVSVCVFRSRGCGRLSSQQCFKANIANGAEWPAAWRAVRPPEIPASL